MNDDLSVDEALSEIVSLSGRIDALPPGNRHRVGLEHRRDQLRAAAREASDASRSDAILRHELDSLQQRLAQIDERPIGKGWAEKGNYGWVNDPSAYSRRINRELEDQDAVERTAIISRIQELKKLLGSSGGAE